MRITPSFENQSLTEVEVYGLSSKYNLADGHSYIDAQRCLGELVNTLPSLWQLATQTPVPEMERIFKTKFAEVYGLQGLKEQYLFSICPTASNSIDIVGAWARAVGYRVGLVEPTFDNLAQLLKRREVPLAPISEELLTKPCELEEHVKACSLDALFLVTPNNPTGFTLTSAQLEDIIAVCAKNRLTLILDTSFRFCHTAHIDEYALLQASGVSYIILEDTGKLWPTLDTKASLLSYSSDIAPLIRKIYEELYLCSSNLSLSIIGAAIDETIAKGGVRHFHTLIQERTTTVKAALSGLPVSVENPHPNSTMSVLWINIRDTGMNDLELVRHLSKQQVTVLPGRFFFWNSSEINGTDHVRIALMKPDAQFSHSIKRLRESLLQLGAARDEDHHHLERAIS
jgi:aspartate/methionine/tyrosine aminotransferase